MEIVDRCHSSIDPEESEADTKIFAKERGTIELDKEREEEGERRRVE